MKISSSTIATLAIAATAIGGSAFAMNLNTPVSTPNQSTNLQVVDPLAPVGEIIIDTAAPLPPVDETTPVDSPTPVAPTPTLSPTPIPTPDVPVFNSDDEDDEEYGDDDDYGYEDEDDDYGYESEHDGYDDEDDD
ncbi:MAG: hypothetical protein ACOYJ7_01500 [Rhodoluna sp.]